MDITTTRTTSYPRMAELMSDTYANPLLGFDQLYAREYPALIAVATALSGQRFDSEDLVQDTMVRALANWRKVQTLDRPGGWCHRVLMNRYRSWWKRRRTEQAYLARQPAVEAAADGPSVETVAFWDAVRELPARPRQVVVLYYAGDLPVAEVASVLGIPEGTVRSDLARARTFLEPRLAVRGE
jgi:RNA polymerase sigma-70 factor, ECF subfamily